VGPTNLASWTATERNTLNGILTPSDLQPPPPPPPLTCIPWDKYEQLAANASNVTGVANTLPAAFDWRERGWVTPVKFQSECRSCWAFAASAAIETLWASNTKVLVDISPQAFVDCQKTTGFFGCNGASMHAYTGNMSFGNNSWICNVCYRGFAVHGATAKRCIATCARLPLQLMV